MWASKIKVVFLVPHTSLTFPSGARKVNKRQEMSVFWSPNSSWLLPCHCTLRFLYPYRNQTCVCEGRFFSETHFITYAWHTRCQLQTYLNTSVMMAISHPTVIYPWLFGLLCVWGRGRGKERSFGLCTDHRGTLGLLSVCRILPQNETLCFSNLVK